MADTAEGAGFWLPSEFFDDFLMEKKENLQSAESDSEFCFPTEFPYDLGTKQDEHLQKPWVMSTSTLTRMDSSLRNDAVGDLIYLAPKLGPPKTITPSVYKQGYGMWYTDATMRARTGQDAWPVQQNLSRIAAVKRECAGTGVFLPRRYGNTHSSDSRRRTGGSIPNRNSDIINGFRQPPPHLHPEYDLLMARRKEGDDVTNRRFVSNGMHRRLNPFHVK